MDTGSTQIDSDYNVGAGPSAGFDEAVEDSLQAMLEDVACNNLSSRLDYAQGTALDGDGTAFGTVGQDWKQAACLIHHALMDDGQRKVGPVSLQDQQETLCDREAWMDPEPGQESRSEKASAGRTEVAPSEAEPSASVLVVTSAVEDEMTFRGSLEGMSKEHIVVHGEDDKCDLDSKVSLHTAGAQQTADENSELPADFHSASFSEDHSEASQQVENLDKVPPCMEEDDQSKVIDSGEAKAKEETAGFGAKQEGVSKLLQKAEHLLSTSAAQIDEASAVELFGQANGFRAPAESSDPTKDEEHHLEEEEADHGPIPFFIINSAGRKAASPRLSNDTIDFGVPDARITADRFVGMRYVREGGDSSQGGFASPGSRLLEAIQEIPAKTVAAAEKTVTSLLAVLPSPRKSLGAIERSVADPAQLPEASNGGSVEGGAASVEATGNGTEAPPSGTAEGERRTSGDREARSSSDSSGMHVWEILWKDHSKHSQDRPGGTLQQVQFETSKAGFRFIQRIIDVWSLEATDSSAMTEAAKKLLKAQDRFQDTATDSPFSKPDSNISTFPRSLFGRARPVANGSPASSAQLEILQRAPSEALSSVERTESGVSVADSVESVSSVKSVASGSGLSIALVASGNRNGYEGGLQHVVIPESDKEGGPPPPEKPGAPLVEGRFLPNMIPHSHILQQPHIRALAAALPVRYRLSAWALLYSTWRDGISLQTLYRKATKKGPGILVILDKNRNVFGCYTSENWKVHPRYYGSGECFVFQLYPEMRIHRWTHDNNYFMFGTPDSVHIGGGSHFALSVRGDLLSGCTGSCETFGNGPLVTPEEYRILQVEFWGFQ